MLRLRHVAAGIAILAAACSNDTPAGSTASSTTAIDQDVADLAADGAAEDAGAMSGMDGQVISFPGGAAFMAGGNGPHLAGCTFADGSFSCSRTRVDGLDVTRTVTLYDAAGATQSAYDKLTTASIHVVMDVTGDITRGEMTATVARHHDFTVTGLAGTETTRTVNGSGTESASRSGTNRNGKARNYSVAGTNTSTNIVFEVHSDDSDPYPLSGTSTRIYIITPASGTTSTRTVVINYDGTATPSGTLNGEPYTFDLTNHKGIKK